MNSLWFWRASGTMPARNVVLKSFVEVVQIQRRRTRRSR